MERPIDEKDIDIILYHKGCQDGETANYIFKHSCFNKFVKEIQSIGILFEGNEIDFELIKDKNIIIVDILPKNIEKIKEVSKNVYVLDHHISSQKKAKELKYCFFNLNLSGCGLAYEYCYGNLEIPLFIKCIQDRDLWAWKIENSDNFTTGLYEYNYDFNLFVELFDEKNSEKFNEIVNIGKLLNKKKINTMRKMFSNTIIENIKIENFDDENYKIIKFNCMIEYKSDFGNYCMNNADIDFCVLWHYDHVKNKYYCSLRSNNDKEDVSLISSFLNGGGHRNASGFESSVHPNLIFLNSEK
jgi:oligoribonuclease NrnB/cAMP/cGMP phosphodiesterase (DHH superfamily)